MKIHFIGIGGIGVSALAQYYLVKGHQVSGSDLVSSEITKALKKLGMKIAIGKHKKDNLPKDVNLVIYSLAIQKTNPELKTARKKRIKCLSYPQALGELTKKHFTIAVSGTHGKSTTASMIGLLLVRAGFDPTVIVGTKLKEFGNSNCRVGKSKYLVIEADEHSASFLNYWPKIIVLTNIEKEHLDYYKNLNNILKTYKKYIGHLLKDGCLVVNKDDKNIYRTISTVVKNVLWYSLKNKESEKLRKILKIPGEHNVYNALAALAVGRVLKIPDKISFKALSEYKGSWRRFEEKQSTINNKRLTIISDYAHHPTEIKVTLKAAREKFPKKKIWCIFQPHQYQRTYYLFNDFVKVFKEVPVDKVIITDIYDVAGREKKKIKEKVNSKKLVRVICKSLTSTAPAIIYLAKGRIVEYLKKNLKGGEVVIIMGAGDIYNMTLRLTKNKMK
ncbi:MAG: Mur ligase domain-containing protein [Patescibacteria group bacterium]|nr:Mur ligase domain-containing protein [Patescibacteria group bacterium]